MIAELCLTDDQLRDNGYPRCGGKSGVATIFNNRIKATPINENERYCRRCGSVFNFSEYDEDCVDRCNYHPKSPGFRRGNYCQYMPLRFIHLYSKNLYSVCLYCNI